MAKILVHDVAVDGSKTLRLDLMDIDHVAILVDSNRLLLQRRLDRVLVMEDLVEFLKL